MKFSPSSPFGARQTAPALAVALMCATLGLLTLPARAQAFDYLEHSYLTDFACREVQRELGSYLVDHPDPKLAARFLALAIACPARWEARYCDDDYKQLEANLNLLDEPPAESGDLPITLGDFAALPDHLSQWGAIRGLARAEDEGLTSEVISWLDGDTSDVGGVIADVGEDGCETGSLVDWEELDRETSEAVVLDRRGDLIPAEAFATIRRAPLNPGPRDDAALYSFDNPHYLDLVLSNHHHFNDYAHASWLGFHSTATDIAERTCEDLLPLDEDDFEDLAGELPAFEDVKWSELDEATLAKTGCAVIATRIRTRLARWAQRAPKSIVTKARPWLDKTVADDDFANQVVAALISVVFEGGGLHFLQDSLSGGHGRMDRAAWGLERSRYFHDADGRQGVSTLYGTRTQARSFVAYGDGWLLGRSTSKVDGPCPWSRALADPGLLSACLLRAQRGIIVGATMASLFDWALGGLLYASPQDDLGPVCTRDAVSAFVCDHLPTSPPAAAGLAQVSAGSPVLVRGDLPEPPPPFAYQAISLSTSIDGSGNALQTGLRVVFLSEIDNLASWMSSYNLGLMTTRRLNAPPEILGEFTYMFHWRWAARFLVNLGPFAFGGLRGFGPEVSFFGGIAPSAGISLLPEGWINLPVEFSLSYRLPITLVDSAVGLDSDAINIEAHWIEIGLGLAFF